VEVVRGRVVWPIGSCQGRVVLPSDSCQGACTAGWDRWA